MLNVPRPTSPYRWLGAIALAVVACGSACSATPTVTIDATMVALEPAAPEPAAPEPIETAAPEQLAFVDETADERDESTDDAAQETEAEETAAEETEAEETEADETKADETEPEVTADDPRCAAYAAVWIQTEVFVALRSSDVPNLGAIASSLLDSSIAESRATAGQDLVAMADALSELDALVADEFHHDWAAFATSEAAIGHPAEVAFETERDAVARFIDNDCPGIDISDLADAASAATRTLDQNLRRLTVPVEPSDSIDGFSTYERSSGRFEVSFPTEWQHFEVQYGPLVEFVASPEPDAFLDSEPVDGIRVRVLRMFDATELDPLIAETRAAAECSALGADGESGAGVVPGTLTRQTYDCGDHHVAVFTGFDEARRTGIIVEATYNGPSSTGPEVIDRIAVSLTWGSIPG